MTESPSTQIQSGADTKAPMEALRALDLSNVLKHALISGRDGVDWVDYDPTPNASYTRVAAALSTPSPSGAGKVTEALKPCPFCGKEPVFTADRDVTDGYDHSFTISCFECGFSISDEYQSGAAESWNRRSSPEGVTAAQYERAADRLTVALEGELDGLCVEMDKARIIMDFVLTETFGRAPA
jgi:Lar family restriction alleviation protein